MSLKAGFHHVDRELGLTLPDTAVESLIVHSEDLWVNQNVGALITSGRPCMGSGDESIRTRGRNLQPNRTHRPISPCGRSRCYFWSRQVPVGRRLHRQPQAARTPQRRRLRDMRSLPFFPTVWLSTVSVIDRSGSLLRLVHYRKARGEIVSSR